MIVRAAAIGGAAAMACLFAGAAPASADDRVDCAHAINQNDMNTCAEDAYNASDVKLNALYNTLTGKLDGKDIAQIKTAQRAWIAYRDAECTYTVRNNEGGSIYPLVWFGCLKEQTEMRTKQLREHLDCVDGKDSCTEE